MELTIKYDKPCVFTGRNGTFKASGLIVSGYEGSNLNLNLFPVTSRGKQGNCWIEVEQSKIQDFVKAITSVQELGMKP